MPWWGWIAAGTLLLTAEMGLVDAEFYLVFLGVSALLVGLLGLAGVGGPAWLQWLLFAALAVVSLVAFRRRVYSRIRGAAAPVTEGVTGERAWVRERIEPGGTGVAELHGSRWTARNDGDAPLEAGSSARVVRAEGVVLHLRPEA